MGNFLSTIASGLEGGAIGFLSGGPAGAAVGAVNGVATAAANPAGGVGNISTSTDPTVAAQQLLDQQYENTNFQLQAEELRHQTEMQIQSQQFNDVQDEKSEQMREMNTLRSVAMKQREADDKIVKEFIKTTGGE
jgi:hypothetical protein